MMAPNDQSWCAPGGTGTDAEIDEVRRMRRVPVLAVAVAVTAVPSTVWFPPIRGGLGYAAFLSGAAVFS